MHCSHYGHKILWNEFFFTFRSSSFLINLVFALCTFSSLSPFLSASEFPDPRFLGRPGNSLSHPLLPCHNNFRLPTTFKWNWNKVYCWMYVWHWIDIHFTPWLSNLWWNAKLGKQSFWHCYENGLIKTIQTISHNLCLGEFQVGFPLLWIRINQDKP